MASPNATPIYTSLTDMTCWHRNEAPEGVTMLHMTPREGGRHSWVDPES